MCGCSVVPCVSTLPSCKPPTHCRWVTNFFIRVTLHSRRLRRQDLSFSYEHSRMHLSRSLQHSTSQVLRFYALVAYILGYLVHSPQQNSFIPVTLQSSQGSFTLAGFGLQLCTLTNTPLTVSTLYLLPRFSASLPF